MERWRPLYLEEEAGAGAGAGRGPAAACIMYQPLPGLGVCYSGALSSSGYPHGRLDARFLYYFNDSPNTKRSDL